MGKELIEEEQAPVRQLSHDSSQEEAYQQPDLEKDAATQDLSRVVSGPPYTIFSHRTKLFIVAAVSISSLISPFGATTFYPALNVLAADLHVTPSLINLSLTTYMACCIIEVTNRLLTVSRSHKLSLLRSLPACRMLLVAACRSSSASSYTQRRTSVWLCRRVMQRCSSCEWSKHQGAVLL